MEARDPELLTGGKGWRHAWRQLSGQERSEVRRAIWGGRPVQIRSLAPYAVGYAVRDERQRWVAPAAFALVVGQSLTRLGYSTRDAFDIWMAIAAVAVLGPALLVKLMILEPRRKKAKDANDPWAAARPRRH